MSKKQTLLAVMFGAFGLAAIAPGCLASSDNGPGEDSGDDGDAVKSCAAGSTVKGIDVAYYQETINWSKVKAGGYAFAFARVSDGTTTIDSRFQSYWPAMKSAGMIRGVYQFFRPEQSVTGQANIMINNVDWEAGDLPPVLDVEVTDGVSSATIVSRIKQWVQLVGDATGRRPIIYASPGIWNGISGSSAIGDSTDLWIANYGVTCPTMANGYSEWKFWQSAESGSVPGITAGGVDHDVWNGTLDELIAYANGGGDGSTTSGGAGGSGAGGGDTTGSSTSSSSSSSSSSSGSSSSGGGMTCGSDGDCNPGVDGSGLRCVSGSCEPGCNASWECPGNTTCHSHVCK